MYFDLNGQKHSYPNWLKCNFTLKPDAWVLLKDGSEFIIELTVPWEENFDKARERKRAKYLQILRHRQVVNFRTSLVVFEVGARGRLNFTVAELDKIWATVPGRKKI
jgi:hypothetical protein